MFARLLQNAAAVSNPKFAIAKRGYDRNEVHDYLEEIAAAFAVGDPISGSEIENRTFRVVKRGYDRVDVHKFLFDVASRQSLAAA